MELADYNIMFVHIKGMHNVLADAISRLKKLHIYKEPLKNPKAQSVHNTQQVIMEICTTSMHTVSIGMLYSEQTWDMMCKNLALQFCHGKKQFQFT